MENGYVIEENQSVELKNLESSKLYTLSEFSATLPSLTASEKYSFKADFSTTPPLEMDEA